MAIAKKPPTSPEKSQTVHCLNQQTTMARELVILLIGPTGSGKTSFVKFATGSDVDISHTTHCKDYKTKWRDKDFRIIDTPGLEDLPADNLAILKDIAQMLHSLKSPRVSGAIFFHRVTDGRFGGSARSHLEIFKQICGEEFDQQAVFLTTMWNKAAQVGRRRYEPIHEELGRKYLFLSPLYTKVLKFENDVESAKQVLAHFAGTASNKQLRLADELNTVGLSLSGMRKTTAGRTIMKGASTPLCVIL
ncbi:P-loop containing nucleoside triphosphate hydrolase protein [Immersiella caudata]|uniref:P-loop containing nucleoside triphosphate hydrolase protein n=1 Tax=Immersiella caudata TaxID=314043 RepID=A0AA39WZ47_9PEZI|nr:P-loop containing nucleoside triphosphate hydrolase protein [Immersiella caudata]